MILKDKEWKTILESQLENLLSLKIIVSLWKICLLDAFPTKITYHKSKYIDWSDSQEIDKH